MKSEQLNELAQALAKAQGQIKGALKDAANPFFKSKYADLASVREACQKPLADNGLSVVQTTQFDERGISLVTTLLHSSGQWIAGVLPVNPVKNDPQALGSAITYMRRYALAAITGVAPEDDDGEAAMVRSPVAKVSNLKMAVGDPAPKENEMSDDDEAPLCCEKVMQISKYGPEPRPFYCPNCKRKEPR